jgi:UDP-glucose 4-epimerase
MDKSVLVLGGSGFLGAGVAKELSKQGYEVSIFDVVRPSEEFTFIEGSILDQSAVFDAVSKFNYVYNFAGIADIAKAGDDPIGTIQLNILGNANILEAIKQSPVERYVYASTAYVYSQSGSFYRCSKQACETYIEEYSRKYGMNYTILRYGSLYGDEASGRNAIQGFIESAVANKKISYKGSRDAVREYIHVDDASKSSVDILEKEFANKHVLLTGTQPMRVKDLLEMIAEMLPFDVEIEFEQDKENYNSAHYTMTPYSFSPSVGVKFTRPIFTDIGEGLLRLIEKEYLDKKYEH